MLCYFSVLCCMVPRLPWGFKGAHHNLLGNTCHFNAVLHWLLPRLPQTKSRSHRTWRALFRALFTIAQPCAASQQSNRVVVHVIRTKHLLSYTCSASLMAYRIHLHLFRRSLHLPDNQKNVCFQQLIMKKKNIHSSSCCHAAASSSAIGSAAPPTPMCATQSSFTPAMHSGDATLI